MTQERMMRIGHVPDGTTRIVVKSVRETSKSIDILSETVWRLEDFEIAPPKDWYGFYMIGLLHSNEKRYEEEFFSRKYEEKHLSDEKKEQDE